MGTAILSAGSALGLVTAKGMEAVGIGIGVQGAAVAPTLTGTFVWQKLSKPKPDKLKEN